MPYPVPGDGPLPPPSGLMVIGERPGYEEMREGRPFVGPAGQELWSRWQLVGLPSRRRVYVTNLVKTFSTEPPTPEEIARGERLLLSELCDSRPSVIVTVGAHAARWFLPAFAERNQDIFHGLAFTQTICYRCAKHAGRFLAASQEDQNLLALDRSNPEARQLRQDPLSRPSLVYSSAGLHAHLRDDSPGPLSGSSLPKRALRQTLTPRTSHRSSESSTRSATPNAFPMRASHHDKQHILAEQSLDDSPASVPSVRSIAGFTALEATASTGPSETACRRCGGGLSQFTVVPTVHSSAALRQPDRFQRQLTRDLEAVREVLEHNASRHVLRAHALTHYDCRTSGRASRRLLAAVRGQIVGCDREGPTVWDTQCVTFSVGREAFLVGMHQRTLLRQVTTQATHLVMHWATQDLRSLWNLGVTPTATIDDSMVAAWLLGEHLGLKTLGYRLLGLQMSDYLDLIRPIDETRMTQALETFHAQLLPQFAPVITKAINPKTGRLKTTRVVAALSDTGFPKRGLTSIAKIARTAGEQSRRQRWADSAFASAPGGPVIPPEASWADLPPAIGVPYANTDAYAHKEVLATLTPRLKAAGLARVYRLDRNVIPMLARIEHVGLAVDAAALQHLSRELARLYDETCAQITDLLGHDLNPKASEDVARVLFEDLDVTPTKRTKKTGQWTTQDKYLNARKHEHAVIPLIMNGRELWKLKGSYTDKLPGMLREGRYHPEWNYTGPKTGRLAEQVIVLIPKHSQLLVDVDGVPTKLGKAIRLAFRATLGHRLVSVDLSQIELRVLAHLSRDTELIKVFEQGRDPHAETAHHVFGAPARKEDQDESLHRLPAKKGNFGAFMGLSAMGLTEQVRAGGNPGWAAGCSGCADPRAEHRRDCPSVEFFREYFKLYRGVRRYIDDRHAEGRRAGAVRTLYGRCIDVSGIYSSSPRIVREAERQAQATPVQATADEISKEWMSRIWSRLIKPEQALGKHYCEPWCRIHDDTVIEVGRKIANPVRQAMLQLVPQRLCVPTTADGKIGLNWGALHE